MSNKRCAFTINFPTAATTRTYVLPAGANRWPWPRMASGANKVRACWLFQNRREIYGQNTNSDSRVGRPVRAYSEPDSRERLECRSGAGPNRQDALLLLRTAM